MTGRSFATFRCRKASCGFTLYKRGGLARHVGPQAMTCRRGLFDLVALRRRAVQVVIVQHRKQFSGLSF